MRSSSIIVLVAMIFIAAAASLCFARPDTATLTGRVIFHGKMPPPQKLRVNRDPEICGTTVTVQPLVIDESSNGVLDVVVSIEGIEKSDLGSMNKTVTLTNKKCAFQPRIDAVTVGEMLELRNDDPMLHNTHIRRGKRTFANFAQVVGGKVISKLVKDAGLMSVRCDKHKFMRGYLFAFDHPYFAITDPTGQFRIEGVPPGRWTLTVWHEILGTLETEVTVAERGEVPVVLEYPAN